QEPPVLLYCGCQTTYILALEVLSFTKVFFIDPQLNWGFYHAYSAPKNRRTTLFLECGAPMILQF
ncbi:MAG: hypothetical protein PUA63_00305, partial [Oscillospiraceae bacterium]|nr:hypothetical protein [Oscillospiraceae bacterium]